MSNEERKDLLKKNGEMTLLFCLGALRTKFNDLGMFMKRLTPEEKYFERVKKQQKTLEEFASHEIEFADDLIRWYRIKKIDMPDDEYRSCAFFKNKEYLRKPGSLTLLYQMYLRCIRELPESTKETAFDLLRYRYKVYTQVLEKGGSLNGGTHWG